MVTNSGKKEQMVGLDGIPIITHDVENQNVSNEEDVEAWWDHSNETSGAARLLLQCQEIYGWDHDEAVKVLGGYRQLLALRKVGMNFAVPRPLRRVWKVHAASTEFEADWNLLVGGPLPFLDGRKTNKRCRGGRGRCGRRGGRFFGLGRRGDSSGDTTTSDESSDDDILGDPNGDGCDRRRGKGRVKGGKEKGFCGRRGGKGRGGMRGGRGCHGKKFGKSRRREKWNSEEGADEDWTLLSCPNEKSWKGRDGSGEELSMDGPRMVTVRVETNNGLHHIHCPLKCRMLRVYRLLAKELDVPIGSFSLMNDGGEVVPGRMPLAYFDEDKVLTLSE